MFLRRCVLALGIAGVAAAASALDANADSSIVPGAFIVEFDGEQTPKALISELLRDKIDIEVRLELSYQLFNGMSLNVKSTEDPATVASRIANNQRVKNIWPVRRVRVPDDRIISVGHSNVANTPRSKVLKTKRAAENSTYPPHLLGQIDRLHAAGYTGKGIRIGIIDSGVDYTHPALGGCFGPGCLVSYGYDFIGDRGYFPYEPDDDPKDDCFGHGTHVAGIIAAQPNEVGILGVAPDVELGAYRTLDCIGSGLNDIIIAAFNRAYEDGSDIITASLGIEGGWPDDPWSLAVERIADAGVPVIIAAGNDGESGVFSPSNPASSRGAASIASVDTAETPVLLIGGTFNVDDSPPDEFGWVIGYPTFGNLTKPLYYLGQAQSNGTFVDACSPLPDSIPDLSDYVVLIENGACQNYNQGLNILEKGGKNILFFGPNDMPGSTGYLPPEIEGAGVTTLTQGKAFVNLLLKNSSVTITFIDPTAAPPYLTTQPNTLSGGLASFFTSWGPNWDLSTNPSFGAPGSKILSTFPLALGSYSVEEGTSMACPYAAGAIALIAQARDTLDWNVLNGVVTSTSRPLTWVDRTAVDSQRRLAPVLQVGGGIIQAWDAAHAKGILSTTDIAFNDTKNLLKEATFSLKNIGSEDATYVVGHTPALTMYAYNQGSKAIAPFPNAIVDDAAAEISFESTSVKISAGQSVEIKVRCTPPINVDVERLPIYSGYITLNGTNGDKLVLPYSGVAASMTTNSRTFNTENPLGISLGRVGDRPPIPLPADTVFRLQKPINVTDPATLPSQPWPIARAATHLGTADSRVDVVPLNGTAPDMPRQKWLGYDSIGLSWGSGQKLVARGSVRSVFTGLLDDLNIVPEGRYQFVISVLKVLGNKDIDEDWEVAELVPFYIEYV